MEEFIPVAPRVASYDPRWADQYAHEAALLSRVLTDLPHTVEDIGSTAVPGLPAKPVIDIMIGVPSYEQFDELRMALESAGYVWDQHAEQDDPARQVFRKGPEDRSRLRSHHPHLTIRDGEYWQRILAFRDQLRRDPAAAAEYAEVKHRLVAACGGDSRAYTAGKRDVVKKIERQAGMDLP